MTIDDRGIFRLRQVNNLQLSNNWKKRRYTSDFAYGFESGGPSPGGPLHRIEYANDLSLSLIRSFLPSEFAGSHDSVGNSSFAWTGGFGTSGSRVYRLNYSNDSTSVSLRGPLDVRRGDLAATGNSSYGWFGGGFGFDPAPGNRSIVDRIDYSNDGVTASPRGPLSLARNLLAAAGNNSYGWFGGGYTSISTNEVSRVDRIDYSNDTVTASPRGPLSLARGAVGATGNSSYGWFCGGVSPAPSYSRVDRIDYSNDTATASPRGPLGVSSGNLSATGNSSSGWVFGGLGSSPIYRIDYSNDTATQRPRGQIDLGPSPSANINSAVSAAENELPEFEVSYFLSDTIFSPDPFTFATNYGYFGAGSTGALSSVDRINYSNDTATASPRGPLSIGRDGGIAATGNSFFGYFAGGPSALASTTVDRIDYSNDTATTSVRGPIRSRRDHGATGNSSFGWFIAGSNPGGTITTVDRIDYSNDTATASPRGNVNPGGTFVSATGNSNFGYADGFTFPTINRISYSNDTATALTRGSFNDSGRRGATGNSSFGWFGGGRPGPVSTVDRIDYSNDTATPSPRGPLSFARDSLAATGNSSYGWFGGGLASASARSIVDRIDYSNDTATASPRGRLSIVRYGLGASSAAANALPQ
jgi:hypothetical protein